MPLNKNQLASVIGPPPAGNVPGTSGWVQNNVVVLNGPGLVGSDITRRTRTSPRGKVSSRTTIDIKSEPIIHLFDDRMLGAGPAEAIKTVIQEGIRSITESVAPATTAYRERASRAFRRGANWAVERYKPKRLKGTFEPGLVSPSRKFNDSGQLAEGIFVRQNVRDPVYTVNVPATRLNPDDFSDAGFKRMLDDLFRLVPELGDASKMAKNPSVRRAVAESIDDLIAKARAREIDKRRLRAQLLLEIAGLGRLKGLL